jgi:amino acid/peptide:H+ symporter
MWERFSYYGMRALLVLYLVSYQGWIPREANGVYKWYTSLVYLTPLFGGYLADRFLGLRAAIILGGILMAVGHFLMAFEPIPIFYAALLFLIIGNGFFKPNISTMVGKLYPKNDPRRDGAFTIFYVGINLGAGLAPIVCGSLRKAYGFHAGFTAAGVGMGIGLAIFIVFQRRIARDIAAAGNSMMRAEPQRPIELSGAAGAAPLELSEDDAKPGATGFAGLVAKVYPVLLAAVGILFPAYNLLKLATGSAKLKDIFMPTAFAMIGAMLGFILLRRVKGAARDKSTVIFILFLFVVAFWFAFEQAGSTQNLWAEYFTNRSIPTLQYHLVWTLAYAGGGTAVAAIFLPPVRAMMERKGWVGERWKKLGTLPELAGVFATILALNAPRIIGAWGGSGRTEYTGEEWQSANAFLIVILAPLFSALWVWLAKQGREPSTPAKMGVALTFVALSFLAMMGSAMYENDSEVSVVLPEGRLPGAAFVQPLSADEAAHPENAKEKLDKIRAVFPDGVVPASVDLKSLPPSLQAIASAANGKIPLWFDAKRLVVDVQANALTVRGVLPRYEVNAALQASADPRLVKALEDLTDESQTITGKGSTTFVAAELPGAPAGFSIPKELVTLSDSRKEAFKATFDGRALRVEEKMNAPTKIAFISAGAPAEWRAAIEKVSERSQSGRVPGFWLLLSYFLATLGELCLSPVGLSMVTKLAPTRFASLFMGVWLLSSSVAQYAGGAMGELWGEIAPIDYFRFFVGTSILAALVLFTLVFPVKKLMHNAV